MLIDGTSAAEALDGTASDDTIVGHEGSDTLGGQEGADCVSGDDGDDFVRGGSGDDTLLGGADNDFLSGGSGNDVMDGGAGVDRASFGDAPGAVHIDLTLQGQVQDTGYGQDKLIGIEQVSGTEYNDTLIGDGGDNWLWALGGSDSVSAGGGDDLVSVGAGAVHADGGGGTDTLEFYSQSLANPVNVSLALQGAAQATGDGSMTFTGFENLVGTIIGADTLIGDDGDNLIAGWGGSDSLSGGSGNDVLLGDGTVFPDSSNGGGGPITAFDDEGTSDGDDVIYGGAGNDVLIGGAGDDNLSGDAGDDTVQGGDGKDLLFVGAGADLVDGGDDVDRLSFSGGPAVKVDLAITTAQATGQGLKTILNVEDVYGTAGDDTLSGDGGDNLLWGNNGGNDVLSGRGGDDALLVGAGDHTLDGGTGTDAAIMGYAMTTGVAIDLTQGGAQSTGQGAMSFTAIENLSGTVLGDTLTGDAGANLLAGMKGADKLSGGGGDDVLYGDGEITHVAGVITYLDHPSSTAPAGADGDDTLTGGAGDDSLVGGGGTDVAVFSGAYGDYTLVTQGDGSLVVTDLRGGSPDGADTLVGVETLRFSDGDVPGQGANAVGGTAGDDTLTGGADADTISGLAGDDFLRGAGGADTLSGGDDDDFLNGGSGNDVMDGGAGVDRVSFGDAPGAVHVDLTLQGQVQDTGYGQDKLIGIEQVSGTEYNDTLIGDGGDNWLWALGGSDSVSAGGGDDLVSVGAGAVHAAGGGGTDTLEFYSQSLANPVNVSLALQGAAQTTGDGSMTFTGFENLVGTIIGADTLIGDGGANLIAGWGGSDSLSGGGGGDTLMGDGTVFPDGAGGGPIGVFEDGAGADTLDGGSGDDVLQGGDGDDLLLHGAGADTLDGGAGVDTASFAGSTAWVDVDLGAGTVAVNGVAEDAIANVENVIGSANWDRIVGDGANNSLQGGGGHDYVNGAAGNDTLRGGDGDDMLSGGAGDDILDGGQGVDRAAFSAGATAGVTVNLNVQGTAQNTGQGMDVLIGIENVSGTAFSDHLIGDNSANWIWSGSDGSGVTGADTLEAGGGNDLVQVGTGDHSLSGGSGVDTLSFDGNGTDITAAVNVSLAGQGGAQVTGQGAMTLTGFEQLSGSLFNDTLGGDSGSNLLAGWDGDDRLSGGAGNDVLLGDSQVTVDTHPPVGTSGSILTVAGDTAGADTLDGGVGDDLVKGEDGADVLTGGTGNDTVDAGAGADTVTAQALAGETTLITLGTGVDKLTLDAALAGQTTVTDFKTGAGGDQLDLNAWLTAKLGAAWNGTDNPFEAGFLRLLQQGSSTLLQINPDGVGDDYATVLTLQNTSTLQFQQANLGFTPLPRVVGGATGDTFVLTEAEFTPGTPGHTVEVDGGAGTDAVQIVAPALVGTASTIMPSPDGTALLMDLDGDGVPDLTITNVEDIVLNGHKVVISGDLSATGLAPNTIHYQGTAGDDLLDAGGLTSLESIRAEGLDGADTLIGADDDDTLDGGDGADSLDGRGGPDLFEGGAGDDTIQGGSGTDTAVFSGLSGDYTVTDLGGGVLEVDGADGHDKLTDVERLQFDDGGWGENTAPAGSDRNVSIHVGGSRTLGVSDFGFSDADGDALAAVKIATLPLTGALRDNGVAVTAGQVISVADIIGGKLVFTPAGAGTESFTFQVQDDGLVGWGANLDASPNTLTLTTANTPVVSPPPPPPSTTGTEGVDHVIFGNGADTFSAGGGDDTVNGGGGADWIHGNAGADTLVGGDGLDTLYGGRDADRLSGDAGDDWLSGDAGADTLIGGEGADTAFGGDDNDRIEGGDGESYLRGGLGNDVVVGGADFDDAHGNEGDDTVSGGAGGDWVVGGKDQDRLAGEQGDDIVYGNLGNDTCDGGEGADIVRGGQGDDLVYGNAGDDWLAGDRGSDTITGGAGADTFHTWSDAGMDRVLDFNAAEGDRVNLLAGSTYTVSQVGADTVIDMGGGNQMVLVGVTLTSLPTGWIFES